jgi:uncharacterized protein (TIGR04255 family)
VSYNRPIIVEIYADLYLKTGGLPFARFFDVVPELQRHGFTAVEAGDAVQLETTLTAVRMLSVSQPQQVRCWSNDRSRLVQLGPDRLTMNLVSPDGTYPGWSAFHDHVVTPTFASLTAAVPMWQPASVALNALDRTAVGGPSFRLGDYLNCGGPRLPSVLADTTVAFDYEIGRGILQFDGRNRQLHVRGRADAGSYVIEMHSVLHDRVDSREGLSPVLDRLHDESVQWFESLITDRMRNEVMEGEALASSRL